jgi:hypothetical protein
MKGIRDAVLLIFENKKDLPNAMNAAEITNTLGLPSLCQWRKYIDIISLSNVLPNA